MYDPTIEGFKTNESGKYVTETIPEKWREIFQEHEFYNASFAESMDPFQVSETGLDGSQGFMSCFPFFVDFGEGNYRFYHIYPYAWESDMNDITSHAEGGFATVYILKPTRVDAPQTDNEDYLRDSMETLLLSSFMQNLSTNINVVQLDHKINFDPFNEKQSGYNVVLGKGLITFWDQDTGECLTVITIQSLIEKGEEKLPLLTLDQIKEWVHLH